MVIEEIEVDAKTVRKVLHTNQRAENRLAYSKKPITLDLQELIATPYAGQVSVMLDIVRKLTKDRPEHDWRSMHVGTTEWWQGRQAAYMIVDLLRVCERWFPFRGIL